MVYLLLTLNTSFWGIPNINWLLRIKKRRSKPLVNGEAFPEPHGHGNPMFIMVWAVSRGLPFLKVGKTILSYGITRLQGAYRMR